MALFGKDNCAICGKEIGMLGKLKVEDGVICRECAGKLSPFFSGRKKSTVSDIKEQLAYREKNKEIVKDFNPDVILGEKTKIYVESGTGRFAVCNYDKWRDHNPDIMIRTKVNSCDITAKEHKDEIYDTDSAGEKISYEPPRYDYTYEFETEIHVDYPYFDVIKFELTDPNHRPSGKDSLAYRDAAITGRKIQALLLPNKFSFPKDDEILTVDITVVDGDDSGFAGVDGSNGTWTCECGHVNKGGKFCSKCGKPKPERWFCPDCGKENFGQFCIACGRKKPE